MAVKPSRRFIMLLLLLHMITAVVVYVTDVPPIIRLTMLLLILLSLLCHLARDVLLLLPGSWCDIAFDQSSVSVVSRDGSSILGQVANKTVVSPYFVVLRIRSDSHWLPVFRVIFPDALGAGEFRELCVRLRCA